MRPQSMKARFPSMTKVSALLVLSLVTAMLVFAAESARSNPQDRTMRIRIIVDGKSVAATLDDNPSARDFASLLPLELTLSDYASTEKVSDLPRRLSIDAAPRSYKPLSGDITYYAPWGNLAIFYRGFGDSAGLVKLGRIDTDVDALRRDQPFQARFEIVD